MSKVLILLLFFVVLSAPFQASAREKIEDLTQLSILQESQQIHPGQTTLVGLKVRLFKPHWHTYWKNPGDTGAAPKIKITSSQPIEFSEIQYPLPKRIETKTLVSYAYEDEVIYLVPLRVAENVRPAGQLNVKVDFEWLVCEEVCIPAFATQELSWKLTSVGEVKPGRDAETIQKASSQIPPLMTTPARVENESQLFFELPQLALARKSFDDFFPASQAGLNLKKPRAEIKDSQVRVTAKRGEFAEGAIRAEGLLILKNSKGERQGYEWAPAPTWRPSAIAVPTHDFRWGMLLAAFLGGLILNLMPCVLPILSLKLFTLTKQSAAQAAQVRFENLAYTAGVVLSFVVMGIALLALRTAGEKLGWGFQLQSPMFLALMAILFFMIALNLIGAYEFDLVNPNWGSRHIKHPALSSFFTGVLAVVVASPCTAPFMGAALGYALTQSAGILILIFVFLGLGLAFPYLLFAVSPSLVRFLPKPGAWMKTLKELMAFPMLLTALWLLWILAQVAGNTGMAMVLMLMIGLGFCVWLPNRKLAWVLGTIQVLAFIAFFDSSPDKTASASAEPRQVQGSWQNFDPSILDAERTRPYFINFTADWCLTCKVNERVLFQTDSFMDLMKKHNVALMKADWTQRNPEISDFLARYDRIGVPLYLLFPKGQGRAEVLPEVLTLNQLQDKLKQMAPTEGERP